MDSNTIQQSKQQIEQIFVGEKTIIELKELQKYFDSNNIMAKIPEGIVNSISKQSYRLWHNKNDKNINKLLLYQIYDIVYIKCKQKPDLMDNSINQYDDKLKKIAELQIQINVFKQAVNQHKEGHIYSTYILLLKKYLQTKNANQPQTTIKKQQQLQWQSMGHGEKKEVVKQEKDLHNGHNFEQIFQNYCKTEQIQAQKLILLNKQGGLEIDKGKLKQFKAEYRKVIDGEQTKYSLDEYRKWIQKNKSRPEKIKEQKQIQISDVQSKGQEKKQNKNKNIESLIIKYFKSIEKLPNTQHTQHTSPNFDLELKLDSTPIQNNVEYKIKIMVGEKQLTQLISDMSQKRLIESVKQNQYYVLKIWTKKSQQLEEKVQSYIKEKKINTEGYKLRTFTQTDKIYISFQFKNQNKSNFLQKIHEAIAQKKEQSHCKIEQRLKFGIGNELNKSPEDRKLIKCLCRGFQFNLNILGSSDVNYRFRKNLQLQNSTSYLFPILAISKNSSLKMRWKKIQDLNSFFNKLGVLDTLKTTPSIKQLIGQTVNQIFHSNHKNMDIRSILSTILSDHDTSKISLINLNQRVYAQLSLNNYVKHLLKK